LISGNRTLRTGRGKKRRAKSFKIERGIVCGEPAASFMSD